MHYNWNSNINFIFKKQTLHVWRQQFYHTKILNITIPDNIKMTMTCIGSPIYNFININNDNFVFLMYFLDGFMLSEDNKSLYK